VYGFATQLEALPDEKWGVAAVASLDASNAVVSRLTDYAFELLLARREGRPFPDYVSSGSVPASRAEPLVGRYRSGDRDIELSVLNGRVRLLLPPFLREVRSADDDGGLVADDLFGFGPRLQLHDDRSIAIGDQVFLKLEDQPPEECPERWRGLIGEYGPDYNTLLILEDRGSLVALIEWLYYYPLKEIGEDLFAFPDEGLYAGERLQFTRDASGVATQVVAAEMLLPRRKVGADEGETFRIEPVKPIDELQAAALAATPPQEEGDFRPSDLVELVQLDPTIKLDVRYATTNNFMGSVFYRQPRAFLQRPAAEALVRVHQKLKEQGLGLMVFDAYRPWYVTKMFWDATPAEMKHFVANPAGGSRHNRGCAVDLTLVDLRTGRPLPMPAGYDEFSARSYPTYPGGTSLERWNRELLRRAMEAEGLTIYEYEWWHFDYKDWRKYRIGTATFEDILGRGKTQ
jgi:D-alanyl-D-alanine dipeptidase